MDFNWEEYQEELNEMGFDEMALDTLNYVEASLLMEILVLKRQVKRLENQPDAP